MENLIYKFIYQVEEAHIIAAATKLKTHPANKVLITGMGGSGIAGQFVTTIMNLHGTVPVITSNNYEIPVWVDEFTLAIVSSYSGNTEETIEAFEKLVLKNAKIVILTSGGILLRRALKDNIDHIRMPADWNAPRACLGYSIIFQLFTLLKYEVLKLELSKELSIIVEMLIKERDTINTKAKYLAQLMGEKIPLIYTDSFFEPLGIRFRQQLNENSKVFAFNAILPEMNHNEIAAWINDASEFSVIFFQSGFYTDRINRRIELSKEIMIKHTDSIIDIELFGDTILQQFFYSIHLTDWISWYVAKIKKVDAMDITNILYLKKQLEQS